MEEINSTEAPTLSFWQNRKKVNFHLTQCRILEMEQIPAMRQTRWAAWRMGGSQ